MPHLEFTPKMSPAAETVCNIILPDCDTAPWVTTSCLTRLLGSETRPSVNQFFAFKGIVGGASGGCCQAAFKASRMDETADSVVGQVLESLSNALKR